MTSQTKGRLILVAIVLLFAFPALMAKTVLSNHWYQSGVTNKGQLIEPRITLDSLGISHPAEEKRWQVGYVVPSQCNDVCKQHVHLLIQSHTALGKEQGRVVPVLLLEENSDVVPLGDLPVKKVHVNSAFMTAIHRSEMVILDPLGQLVMHYPVVESTELVGQSKSLLSDLRKLLKLSRVG